MIDLMLILATGILIGLKIANYIDWSWWLIFSPAIVLVVLYAIFAAVVDKGKRY